MNKHFSDFQRTGRFDYELCYLLRKQEAQEDLKSWIGDVIKRRSKGDEDFGKDVTPDRFNHLVESSESRVKTGTYFRDVFLRSLVNDIEN